MEIVLALTVVVAVAIVFVLFKNTKAGYERQIDELKKQLETEREYAKRMLEEGIYVTGFYYPVVPKEQARIRVQISAGHNREQLDKCIGAFIKVGKELGVLK